MSRAVLTGAVALFAALFPFEAAHAQGDGVSSDRILFGQSAAFSGPAAELGNDFSVGVRAAFKEANRRGGVHGRRLELLSLDDAYEPEAAIANTRILIEEKHVFSLIGAIGTPTSRSAAPITAEAGVPYVAPFTGAGLLRTPDWENIVNLRASYFQETAEIVERLVTDLGIKRIGVLFQDDSFGHAGLEGAQRGLSERGLQLAATGSYMRNTTAVKTAVLELRAGNPGAVILVGAYTPVAAAIKWARQIGFEPVFVTISFTGGRSLARELGELAEGVFVTQVVPFPMGEDRLAVRYRRALAAQDARARPGFVSFEGYLAGRLAIVGLERSGPDVDRITFLDSLLRGGPINIDGFRLRFGEGDNQGSDRVFLTVFRRDGQPSPISTLASGVGP